MGLEDVIKETKAQLEEAEKLETPIEEVKEEPVKEEVKVEEPKEEKPVEEAKPKTDSDYARERRANRDAKRDAALEAANARIAELERLAKPVVKENAPDPIEDPKGYVDHRAKQIEDEVKQNKSDLENIKRERANERLREQANGEIQNYEAQVRSQYPDYDDVKSHYANMLAASIKNLDPDITQDQLVKQVTDKLMLRASKLYNNNPDGNPIAALYEEGKRMGYQPKSTEKEEKELKPDLAKVAANRARNAGTAAAIGKGGEGELTPTYAASLTNAEFARLPASKKAEIFKQLGAQG